MNSVRWTRSSHPTDEELLAFLDGELDGRALSRIRTHLDACWPCRGRRDRFNHAIAAFVDARLEDCARHDGFPPSAALKLSARLDEVDARATRPSLWRRMFWRVRAALAWRPTPAAFTQGCVAALTLALIVVSIGREPSVSAQELLARTVAAQEARLRPVPQPVLYQRLQVRRRTGGGGVAGAAGAGAGVRETQQTWEIWSDTVHGRYRQRVGSFAPIARRAAPDAEACGDARPSASASAPLTPTLSPQDPTPTRTDRAPGAPAGRGSAASAATSTSASASAPMPTPIGELESILCANGLRSAQPLSARAWVDWRGRLRGAFEQVRQERASDDSPAELVLHTRLPGAEQPMRIREAELVVRADDWHPLAQRFTVENERELVTYELRELSFEVVELASVAPTFFDEPAEAPPASIATAAAAAAAEAVSDADVIAAEVQAWEALYRLGALRGEPVEIVRSHGLPRVEVRGLASSPERKQAIADAVSAIPLVTASIRTVDEALAAKPLSAAAAAAPAAGAATVVQTGTVPILPLIEASSTAAAQALASDVVSLSREAMTEAWALERLARFAQGLDASAVRPSSRRALERMASELAAATAAKLDALDERITPMVAPLLDRAPSTSPTAEPDATANDAGENLDWPRLALHVFARAREADELTRRLFTESDAGLVELGPSARQLIAACAAGRQDALTLSERLTSQSQ